MEQVSRYLYSQSLRKAYRTVFGSKNPFQVLRSSSTKLKHHKREDNIYLVAAQTYRKEGKTVRTCDRVGWFASAFKVLSEIRSRCEAQR